MAIRAGTLTDSSLRARPLFTSYRKIVASPDYVARYGMPQHPSDLKQHHCLGFTEPVIAEYLAGLLLRWPAVRDRSGGVIQ
ncbi:LysR family transcriptional regulator [Klebsiella pneumoniae]|uniref:LysR family transcriptional regulator n=1 Tax=Klebsiella pneumoniae TaxID=573 RepID=A0A378FP00_KLEPN|nr:LysR family transcriptional regulator [Klebsiella pneumoniae]